MPNRLNKLEAIYQIDQSILAELDIDTLLKKVLQIMEQTFGCDTSAVLLYDEQSQELYIRAASGYPLDVVKYFRTTIGGPGLTGHVAQTRTPVYLPDVTADAHYLPGIDGARSEIAIPLLVGEDRLLGVLDVESREQHAFTNDDFETIRLFAMHLSLSLYNALLFEKEHKRASQLMLVHQIRQRISTSVELEALLHIVAKSLVEFFSYYQAAIFIAREGESDLRLIAHAGVEAIQPQRDAIAAQERGIISAAYAENRPILLNYAEASPLQARLFEQAAAELAVPIMLERSPVGVIYVVGLERDAFDEKDLHLLKVISEELSLLIKDAAEFSKLRKKNQHSEIMHKIGQVTIQTFDLKQFLADIVHLIHDEFGYYHVAFHTYEKRSEQLELAAYAGVEKPFCPIGKKHSILNGVMGLVIRSGQMYCANDISKEPEKRETLSQTKSFLALPVKRDEQNLGALLIESTRLNQFESTDMDIFSQIAEQIGYTIANAELYQQKTSAHNLLLNLNSLGREIYATFDLKKIFETVIHKLPIYLNCRLCSIFFYYPEQHQLQLMAHNLPDLLASPLLLSQTDNTLMNRVISLKRSLYITDIEKDLGLPKRPQYQTKSFINMLLQHHERIIGIVNLTDKLDRAPFSEEEFYLVHSFCEHLANAILNSEKYQEILELSIRDGLSGLFVHRYFQEVLSKEISRSQRDGLPLSLIILDFDHFKQFNDRYGHQVGDIILREIAVLIRKEIREHDVACRYGGEEFGLILPATSLWQATALANRLREKIAAHVIDIGSLKLSITVSQGVTEYRPDTEKDAFIKQADTALYQAKRDGRNQVAAYCD